MPSSDAVQLTERTRWPATLLAGLFVLAAMNDAALADPKEEQVGGPLKPVPVELEKTAGGWSLVRAGRPYYIKGAGGPGRLDLLKQAGGNSTRVWGFDQLEDGRLDEAQRHGITVAVGIWLRHDLDYNDPVQVADQIKLAMEGVRKYKNHPAVLVWGIGNEMEGEFGDNPAVWRHVETIAKKIKREDPHHPTMTVVAELGGNKLKELNRYCPSIDIVGVNAYGGAVSVPKRYRERGGTKPYILTEFGPRGPWERPKNSLKSIDEELGSVKAATYLESYKAAAADRRFCLGSYAFMWGHKQEATPTWFGMFLADGRKTAAVDVISQQWSGKPPKNRCPQVIAISLPKGNRVEAKTTFKVKLNAKDPEGQALKVEWVLMEDAKRYVTTGNYQKTPPTLKANVLKTSPSEATFRAPQKPGLYRVYAYVGDGQGGADAANVVFRVEQ